MSDVFADLLAEPRTLTEELFGRPNHLKVFVSSKMAGGVYVVERRGCAEALEATGIAQAWYWERDANAGPYCSEGVCLEAAQALPAGPETQDLLSTALQNRGVVAVERGDPEGAVQLFGESLPLKLELEDHVSAVDILNSLALAVADQGDLDKAERMLSDVEKLSRLLGEPRRLGAALGNRGGLRAKRGDFLGAEADYRAALRFARAEGDPLRELLGMRNVGSSLADQGRNGQAMRWYRRAARLAAQAGAAAHEARLRRSLALMLLRTGRAPEAVPEVQRAFELSRELGHRQLAAECLADLGAVHVELGDDALGEPQLEAAREEFVALGDRRRESQVLRNLAEVALRRDGAGSADALWENASERLEHDPQSAADVARRAAEAWATVGDSERASQWITRELHEAERFEEPAPLAWRAASAGALLTWQKTTPQGLQLLDRAVQVYDELAEPRQASRVRLDRAAALADDGRHDEAMEDLRWCLELGQQLSDRALRQHALASMGELARRRGNTQDALRWLDEAVQLARSLGDDEALAHALGNLGQALSECDDIEAAHDAYAEQLALARAHRAIRSEAVALAGLGNLDYLAKRFASAARRYRRAATLSATSSDPGEVDDVGAWLQATAETGRYRELQGIGQRLIDLAQRLGAEDRAAVALAGTGRVLLRADEQEGAASMYAAAVRVHLTQALEATDFMQTAIEILASTFGLMVAHVELELPKERRQPFYDLVLAELDTVDEGLGPRLGGYLDEIRAAMEETGLLARMREGES